MRIQAIWWLVHQNSSIYVKKKWHRVFQAGFGKKEAWRHLSVSELHGNSLSFSLWHEDWRNVVGSSKFIHLPQRLATVCLRPVLCQKEGWRPFSVSELHGNFLSFSLRHGDSSNLASSLKVIHLRKNGATVRLRPVLGKRKDEGSALSPNLM